ncbi:hypothetical protein [uncultured Desulfovibrio sp.]|uniref:hypothetical protein n=1 Tax=uncultured Desulfovibrio sp. TaxID=167968 RepID=UPI0025DE8596|nr:hypothetical protein [uncultured Desulfovibrio sp.]
MEYQEFLDITDATQDKVSEEDFSTQIKPIIQDRPDLFSAHSAVSRHYFHYGVNGFSDAFIEAWDALTDAMVAARQVAGENQDVFQEMIESSLDRSCWA